jgi:phenylacetate-coenzyme A ligase PaaK-like adenylate-forming protein
MMEFRKLADRIFTLKSISEFNGLALEIFQYQYLNNTVYRKYADMNTVAFSDVDHFSKIPFLPIEFFKSHKIITGNEDYQQVFTSSGTTGNQASHHFIKDVDLYEKIFIESFRKSYGDPFQYLILALLPSYLERKGSSLVYMVNKLIKISRNRQSGFYIHNYDELARILSDNSHKKILLIGVSFALLDLAEKYDLALPNAIIMETGGMKGRRKEMIREELYEKLISRFHVSEIHSEYGMTELLSQAYSKGEGIFRTPHWMKVLIRDVNDPKSLLSTNKTGGINIIDLANIHSCSFIATQDLGRIHEDGGFEVLGRFDNSDIRGCNLLVD